VTLPFLKDFKKALSKVDTVNIGLMKPHGWLSTGNYALNRALSGDFTRGIPLGRMALWAGPAGSGKSFISTNIARHAQAEGYHILVLDSENSLDVDYMRKIGMTVDEEHLTYTQVTTIEDVNRVMAEFFSGYIKAYGKDNMDAPKVLIILDSLAMLSSTTEMENYNKSGEIKADQGILAKRRKAMLRMVCNHIARLPIAFVATDHVYPQDVMLGDGPWAITNSTKFSASTIGIVTKLKLKEDKEVIGVRMRFETYKSRFAKMGTKVELEVPYNEGMHAASGLVELLEEMGVIAKGTQVGEKLLYVTEVEGEKIKFKDETDITPEIAAKLFRHPKAQPVVTAAEADAALAVAEPVEPDVEGEE
jgi:RecA/RadA recombinase